MDIKEKKQTDNLILRINIDGKWSSTDFTNLFESLTILYIIAIEVDRIDFLDNQIYGSKPDSPLNDILFNFNGDLFKRMRNSSIYDNEKGMKDLIPSFEWKRVFYHDLQVVQIKFSSPGFTDFVGFGKIIEQLVELLRYYIPNKEDVLKRESLKQDVISKQIQNLEAMGYSKKEIKKLYDARNVAIINLKQLSDFSDQITGFEIREIE